MDLDVLAKVEEQRVKLEENLVKLKKSLRHWQTLELDYDALQEEFFPLSENATASECLNAAKEAKSDLVTREELETLLKDSKGEQRRPSQIVELLSKRSEYVTRNIYSLRNQISSIEKSRNALLLSKDAEHRDDAALPLSEVIEELDSEGNIVSSRIQNPDNGTSQLIDVLQKAGVKDLDSKDETETSETKGSGTQGLLANNEVSHTTLSHRTGTRVWDREEPNKLARSASAVDQVESNGADDLLTPTHPEDTEEEARLRQEMLQYGLDEVGHIVAELELAENGDGGSQEEDNDENEDDEEDYEIADADADDYHNSDEEDESSEDETGKSKHPLISTEYRKRMEELQKRLGMKNVGPEHQLPLRSREQDDRPSAAEAARKAALARQEASKTVDGEVEAEDIEKTPAKKKVAFASKLDIAPEKQSNRDSIPTPTTTTVTHDVLERTEAGNVRTTTSAQPRSISKFKAARNSQPQTPIHPPSQMTLPPTPPSPSSATNLEHAEKPAPTSGKIISDSLIERQKGTKHTLDTLPSAPNEHDFDEELQRRQIAAEYHKLRNRRIHEQGGYVGGGELDNYDDELAVPVVIDGDSGRPRKISRFKAARVMQQQKQEDQK